MEIEYGLCDKFLNMEYKYDLFSLKILNVNFWIYIREKIYCYILKNKGYIGDSFTNVKNITKRSENIIYKLFFMGGLKYCCNKKLKKVKNKEILIFTHPRRLLNNEIYECTVMDYFLSEIPYEYIVMEEPMWIDDASQKISHYIPAKSEHLYYSDYIELAFEFKYKFIKNTKFFLLSKEEKLILKSLIDIIENTFKIKIKRSFFGKMCVKFALYEKYTYSSYEKLLKKIKPKIILEYYSPIRTKQLVNRVAHKQNILVIDLQHGMFGRNEPLMANYKKTNNLDNYPDYIFTFGDYWNHKARFPLSYDRIISCGYPYFDFQKFKLEKKYIANRNTIVFYSQGKIGIKLSKLASELASLFEKNKIEISIIYKTHPFEHNKWKIEYPWLNKKNIIVVDNNVDIYSLMESCICVVGVYTTSLYESLAIGMPTIIYKDYGYRELTDLKKLSNKLFFVNNAKELFDVIRKDKFDYDVDNVISDYLFKTNSKSNLVEQIKILLEKQENNS